MEALQPCWWDKGHNHIKMSYCTFSVEWTTAIIATRHPFFTAHLCVCACLCVFLRRQFLPLNKILIVI